MIFLFNWMIRRFQPLVFRGVIYPTLPPQPSWLVRRPHVQLAGRAAASVPFGRKITKVGGFFSQLSQLTVVSRDP